MTNGETTTKDALKDLSEDATGFGGTDLRTIRDLLVRPRLVLQAWMIEGPTGGGVYAKALKLYLGLNAIMMLLLFLRGGFGYLFDGIPADVMAPLIEQSGKSRDAFISDADGWMALITIPILAPLYAVAATPLLRLWDHEDLGWRRGFRAAFAYLNAWTIPLLPLSWFMFGTGAAAGICSLLMLVIGLVVFLRMGRGRWFRSYPIGIAKAVLIQTVIGLIGLVGMYVVVGVGILAGLAA